MNFGYQNRKISKIQDGHSVERSIYAVWGFSVASYVKNEHSSSLQTFAFFYPKCRNMTSLKRHFLKNSLTDFSAILVTDVKLILRKVLKVSRRYLLPFLNYRENPAGGIAPPPSGARVNPRADGSGRLHVLMGGGPKGPPSVSPEALVGSEKFKRGSKDLIEMPQT